MSILEFSNLKYTYNGKQSILRGANGKLEQGKLFIFLCLWIKRPFQSRYC